MDGCRGAPTNLSAHSADATIASATRRGTVMERKIFGRYIVADPRICHGKLTFRGTRVFVDSVLKQVAEGRDWESISEEWRGRVSEEAIREAVELALMA